MTQKHPVIEQTKRRRPPPKMVTYLTVVEAAGMLGVTPRYIREQIRAGRVPAYRLGPRQTRLKLAEVEAMLEPVVATDQ